ncbi:MAG: sialate O-acetylesterase [Bacteroidota bacterium]
MRSTTIFFILFLALTSCQSNSNLKLPSLIGDNMLLQQKTDAKIWGNATPGHKIDVAASWNVKGRAKAGVDGKWIVVLPTPEAGGPYSITISANDTSVVIKNILIGEVWFCSGQSNMEMPLEAWPLVDTIMHSAETILSASIPEIRLFNVLKKISGEPLEDCTGRWEVSTPETAKPFSATAYFFGRKLYNELHVPIGLIESAWGGTPAESWISSTALENSGEFISDLKAIKESIPLLTLGPGTPSVLFNGMVNPVLNFQIKGAIWYQGESNVGRADQYAKIFPVMIQNWREAWGIKDFPFYFVQIAPYVYSGVDSTESVYLREAQEQALKLANTGMVTTFDIATVMNIHPPFKKEVGERLALLALNNDYGIKNQSIGPVYKSMSVEGNSIKLQFENVGEGLISKNDNLSEFEIAGNDGKYVKAKAKIINNEVLVSSSSVSQPISVRYCWRNGAEASLFSKAGFPAWQFRTK